MEQLATLGIEQARETYARHGADGELCALLYSDLRALHQRGGAGQELAEASGATANPDTRVLATMVADRRPWSHTTRMTPWPRPSGQVRWSSTTSRPHATHPA